MNGQGPGLNPEARTADMFRRTPKVKNELLEAAAGGKLPELAEAGVSVDELKAFVEGKRTGPFESAGPGVETPRQRSLEAIVRRFGRPVLLIQNGSFAPPASVSLKNKLEPHRARLEEAIKRVGRVEFMN